MGAKAVHRERLFATFGDAVVEIGEGGFADDEERVGVGKRDGIAEAGRRFQDWSRKSRADTDEAAADGEKSGEEGGGLGATVFGEEIFAFPDTDGSQRRGRIGGARHADRRRRRNRDREVRGVEGGRDEGHARKRALGEEAAGFIDDEEAAITDEAQGVDRRGGYSATAKGFDGVEEEAGERGVGHRGEWWRMEGLRGGYFLRR